MIRKVFTYKRRPPASLKEATAELFTSAGGLDTAGKVLGQSPGSVYRYSDPSDQNESRFLNAHQVMLLEHVADYPAVTEFLAAEAGYVLVPLVPAEMEGAAALVTATVHGAADLFQEFSRSLTETSDHGRAISPAEATRMLDSICLVQRNLSALRGVLRQIAGDQP